LTQTDSRAYTLVTCETPSILFDYEDDQRDSPPAREVRHSGKVPLKVGNDTYCSGSNSRKGSIKPVKVAHCQYLFLFAISGRCNLSLSLSLFLSLSLRRENSASYIAMNYIGSRSTNPPMTIYISVRIYRDIWNTWNQ